MNFDVGFVKMNGYMHWSMQRLELKYIPVSKNNLYPEYHQCGEN